MNKRNYAFAEKEPSFFIIQTPFQAMCAINAIRQLKIDNYNLKLHLHKTTEKRNRQTIELFEMYELEYSVENLKPLNFFDRVGLFFSRGGKYNRVFLGTHLYQDGYYYALKELRKGGNLVLLDDGIATLSLLNGGYKVKGRSIIYAACYNKVAALNGIKLNNVLTVYKDKNNSKWNIAFNDISLLRRTELSAEKKNVFFVGTNNSGFISKGVDESAFKKKLFSILKKVKEKHPNDEIIYIPHGRDKSVFVKDYCVELGIEYKPLDINIEIYLLSLAYVPSAIYGFTSSALYNLKRIFPESELNNIIIRLLTDNSPNILEASDYYEQQGIHAIYE